MLRLSKTYKEKFSQKENFSDIIKVNNKKKKLILDLSTLTNQSSYWLKEQLKLLRT